MSVLEIKNQLLQLVVDTDDFDKLSSVFQYFKQINEFPKLTKKQEEQEDRLIEIGEKQISNGQTMTNQEAWNKIDKILNDKQK